MEAMDLLDALVLLVIILGACFRVRQRRWRSGWGRARRWSATKYTAQTQSFKQFTSRWKR